MKKLRELIGHEDNYTIYNFVASNVKKEDIYKIYESIKDKTLTKEDKDAKKKDSPAQKTKEYH